jgi:hypothetical protein
MRFAVLLPAEAQEMAIDWDADVPMTPEIEAALQFPAGKESSQRGRLIQPFVIEAHGRRQAFPVGAIVLADDFGLLQIEV